MCNLVFDNKIDTYLILSPSNRRYFTKVDTSFGCLIISEKSKIFITDRRYDFYVRDLVLDYEIIVCTGTNFYQTIATQCKRVGAKNIGYEDEFITCSEFRTIKNALGNFTLKPIGGMISSLREVKTPAEIDNIVLAQRLLEKILKKMLLIVKPGITEKELSAEITYQMMMAGAEGMAFDNIVAFGENSAKPHHIPSEKKLDKNSIILFDLGCVMNGYRCDMSRTYSIGEIHPELKYAHRKVLEAQEYALKNIKAGMTAHEADSFAREYLKSKGYDYEFGHSLGHGVGIEIHEAPRVGFQSTQILKAGSVITVEPGVYIEGLGGIRIEDMVVVTETGVTNLTNFNKNINF